MLFEVDFRQKNEKHACAECTNIMVLFSLDRERTERRDHGTVKIHWNCYLF
jgi:hypothetical protein